MIFGSEGDWISQHVAVAESLRDAMLTQRSLIPQYINLGGGSSVYDFAYYGLLRPDVLFSCLVPGIDMRYIISGYAILCIAASALLMYLWLRKKGLQRAFSAAGALLLVCSGSFFQFHHQIMFVNYMPYLLLALLGVDRLWKKGRSGLLILSLSLVYLHSFYYAIACLCVVGIYSLYLVLEGWAADGMPARDKRKELLGMVGRLAVCVGVSIALTMVLLLPTGLDILSTSKDAGSFAKTSIKAVDLSFRGLLYSSYSCGMTLLVLYCLLLSLAVKGKRFLSGVLLLCMAVPAVNLVLNGFLYAREKILIPFVPVLVLVTAQTLQRVWAKEQKARLWPVVLCFVPRFCDGWKMPQWEEIVLLDGGALVLWVVLNYMIRFWEGKQKTAQRPGGHQRLLAAGFLLLMAAPVVTSVALNCNEKYVPSDDQRQSRFTREEIASVAADPNYRFDVITDRFQTCNLLYGDTKRSSMYSSINNDGYSTFYYDTIGNAIPANNRVALLPGVNPCANYFLGVRYLLCNADQVPAGYTVQLEKDGFALAENPSVLPICYGTTEAPVLEEKLLETSEPKAQRRAGQQEEAAGQAGTEQEDPLGVGLLADQLKQLCLGLETDIPIAIARLAVDSSGKNPVVISLNGIRNKLSAKNAPYPNNNRIFTYVMAAEGTPEDWEMERSDGDYTLTDIQWTAIEPEEWGSRRIILPDALAEEAATESGEARAAGAKAGGGYANVYQGLIRMPEEGWFVTSYPWREGYEILVDGVSVEPQKVNTAFVGFPLSGGSHEIAIAYTAPGYRIGLLGTVLGAAAFVLLLLWERRADVESRKEVESKYKEGESRDDGNDGNDDGEKENQRDCPLLQ